MPGRLPEELFLELDGTTSRLTRSATASGVKYGNGPIVFWQKGRAATLDTVIGGLGTSCRQV